MHVGRMKSEKDAMEYIQDRLLEVKEILDDIADKTGIVYLCISGRSAELFGAFGNALSESLIGIMQIIPDRIEMANNAKDIAYKANEEAEKKNAEQGDLFSQKGKENDA